MVMAKFVTNVFKVAIFDAAFADQNFKMLQICTLINHFLKNESLSLQKCKKNNNANLEKKTMAFP